MALAPETVLQNRYRIVRQLGQGGMGTVYEAKALRLNTTVALKETHFTDEKLRKQFEREAQLLAGLRHPALPRVIDHFDESAGLYLVMDFIEGDDLWDMLRKQGGAFPAEDVLNWADQLLDALDYLHGQSPAVIHRDIKPQNLKLTSRGQIILLDFGLAKGFAGQISRVTTSGSIFGYTPNYAPLEQIQGTGTDPRSDLYSLAATIYHLMTGTMPPDALSRASASVGELPDPLRLANEINPHLSPAIAAILKRAMAQHPSKRFACAEDMRVALREGGQPPSHIQVEAEAKPFADVTLLASPPLPKRSAQEKEPTPLAPTIASPPPAQEMPVSELSNEDPLTRSRTLATQLETDYPPREIISRKAFITFILIIFFGLLAVGFILISANSN